jgi:hypothetical protein
MLRIWNVYWSSAEEDDVRVGVVYAADEEAARSMAFIFPWLSRDSACGACVSGVCLRRLGRS